MKSLDNMIEKQAWLRLDVKVKNTDYTGRPGSRWGVVRSGALIGRKSVLENTDDERWCGDSRRGQMERQELTDEIQSPHSAECQGLASKSSLAREANGCFILLIFSLIPFMPRFIILSRYISLPALTLTQSLKSGQTTKKLEELFSLLN